MLLVMHAIAFCNSQNVDNFAHEPRVENLDTKYKEHQFTLAGRIFAEQAIKGLCFISYQETTEHMTEPLRLSMQRGAAIYYCATASLVADGFS